MMRLMMFGSWIFKSIMNDGYRYSMIFRTWRKVRRCRGLVTRRHSYWEVGFCIYGGEDTFRHRKDDFWVLDIKTIPCACLQPDTGGAVSLNGSKAWKKLDGFFTDLKAGPFIAPALIVQDGMYMCLVEWLMVFIMLQ